MDHEPNLPAGRQANSENIIDLVVSDFVVCMKIQNEF